MSFDQDDLPRVEFARNPLKVVVAQLRFPTDFRLAGAEALATLQSGLRERYPIALGPVPGVTLELRVGPAGVSQAATPQAATPVASQAPVRFAAESNAWIVAVTPSFLSLETTAYRNGDEFVSRWDALLGEFTSVVTPSRVDRFGVRYVNELWHPEARTIGDWTRFLDKDLMVAAASPVLASRVTRAADQIWLAVGEDAGSLRRIYTQNPPGAEKPSIFLLDVDLFSGHPFSFDHRAIMTRLARYHQWAWNLFRSSITDDMVAALVEAKR